MGTEFCKECHQPLHQSVEGVRLTRFKATLFRYIESHPGQNSTELGQRFYPDNTGDSGAGAIRSHIFQINDALMGAGLRICGGQFTGYHVDRKKGA